MKTPEVIKKVLLECDEGYACKRIECPYDDGLCLCNGSRCMLDARKDALALIQQLEAERDSALSLIGKLAVILRNPHDAATNGCADKARDAIKKWMLHDLRQLSKPKED